MSVISPTTDPVTVTGQFPADRRRARPRRIATIRSKTTRADTREISSRSTKDKCRGDRPRTGGRNPPPRFQQNARIEAADRPRSRPINR